MSNSLQPHGLYSLWNSPGVGSPSLLQWVGSPSLLQWVDLLNPGIEPRSPTLQADSLPAEPQRKPDFLTVIRGYDHYNTLGQSYKIYRSFSYLCPLGLDLLKISSQYQKCHKVYPVVKVPDGKMKHRAM